MNEALVQKFASVLNELIEADGTYKEKARQISNEFSEEEFGQLEEVLSWFPE